MCNFSGNLVAWLDGEVLPAEAERTRLHVENCTDCGRRVDAYRRATLELVEFCDEMALDSRRGSRRWAARISAVAAVAAVVALAIFVSRAHGRHPASMPRKILVPVPRAVSSEEPPSLSAHRVEKVRRGQAVEKSVDGRHLVNYPHADENVYAGPYEPVIEIAIPAEEMFPPGAVPAGMDFAADVSIAADGSPDRLRLQPRLVGFERGTSIQ